LIIDKKETYHLLLHAFHLRRGGTRRKADDIKTAFEIVE
jgi:hypothetical protein